MAETIEKLKKQIEELERQLEANPFGGLFNKDRLDQIYRKLKKKRKQLAELEKPKAKPAKKKSAAKKTPAGKTTPAGKKTKKSGTSG